MYKVNIRVLSPQNARSASRFKQGCNGGSNETTSPFQCLMEVFTTCRNSNLIKIAKEKFELFYHLLSLIFNLFLL